MPGMYGEMSVHAAADNEISAIPFLALGATRAGTPGWFCAKGLSCAPRACHRRAAGSGRVAASLRIVVFGVTPPDTGNHFDAWMLMIAVARAGSTATVLYGREKWIQWWAPWYNNARGCSHQSDGLLSPYRLIAHARLEEFLLPATLALDFRVLLVGSYLFRGADSPARPLINPIPIAD